MSTDKRGFFTEEQYLQIWDMIFSQTGYPVGHPKNESALNEDTVVEDKGGIPLPKDLISTDNLHFVGADGIKKPLTDLYEKKYTQAQVDAIREELEHQINFWKESNNSNYESFKRVAYELRALKKQYGQISLNPDNKAYTGKDSKVDWEIVSFKNDSQEDVILTRGADGYFRLKPHHGGSQESLLLSMSNMSIHSVKRLSDNEVFTIGDKVYETITGKGGLWEIKEFSLKDTRCFTCGININNIQKISTSSKEWTPEPPAKTVTDNTDVACLSLNDVWETLRGRVLESDFNTLKQKVTQKLKTHTP